ncbi:MAG TPA: FAD-dependent oxidoreductase [Pyrinomonadaceae bacterium]
MHPFLLTHRVKSKGRRDFLFDIGTKLYPISIRDQIIRGFMLADCAIKERIIGPDKPLLVVGAGAAGATAAMVAAQRGVRTTLIEAEDNAFKRQLPCDTRWISPTNYDWPAEHWQQGRFPLRGVELPLSWTDGHAAAVALAWRTKLNKFVHRSPVMTFETETTLENPKGLTELDIDALGGQVPVEFVDLGGHRIAGGPHRFAAIVSCIGVGRERTEAGRHGYEGIEFWQSDQLRTPDWGVASNSRRRVLISGGGDGALQDFLRVLTKYESVRDVYNRLPLGVRDAIEVAVRAAEETSLRSYLWNTTRYDCRSQHLLHQKCKEVVQGLVDSGATYPDLQAAMDDILRGLPSEIDVTLSYPCTHFANCYPLNRVLVLLVSAYIKKRYGIEVLQEHREIVDVESADGHACRSVRSECLKKRHRVTFGVARCENIYNKEMKGGGGAMLEPAPYDLVLIRHGIDPPKNLFGRPPEATNRHILPYYIDVDWYE